MKSKILSILTLAILVFTISGIANFSFAAEGTLSEKINNAADGATITLDSDYADKIVIPKGKNIILNLNGKKVTPYGITVENGAKVTIRGNGTVDAQNASTAALYVKEGGNATVEDGTFNSDKFYSVLNQGTTVIKNGTFTQSEGNKKVNSSLIENGFYSGAPTSGSKAKLTINGGTFNHTYAKTSCVKSDSYGDTTIAGGTFNSTNSYASIQATGNVTIKNGTFTNKNGAFVSLYGTKGNEGPEPGTVSVSYATVTAKTLVSADDFGSAKINAGLYNINAIGSKLTTDQLSIQVGTYSQDPSKFIQKGYHIEKNNDKYVVLGNEVKVDPTNITLDTTASVDKVTVGVSKEDQSDMVNILSDLANDGSDTVKNIIENQNSNLEAVVNTEDVSEDKVDEKVLNSIKETVADKQLTVSQYLDISIVVKNPKDGKVVDTVTETPSALKFTVLVPNDLLKDGRKFYVLRNHDGETTVLDTKQDGNKLTFETDKFSTYAVAYTDVADTTATTDTTTTTDGKAELDETPKTGVASPITFLSILAAISVAGILLFKNKNK